MSDNKKATPAVMYMDGVEFMPANKNVLFGFQFKSICGLGPVVGAILAVNWGWLPAMLYLFLGVAFLGWIHDYTCHHGGSTQRGNEPGRDELHPDFSPGQNPDQHLHLLQPHAQLRGFRPAHRRQSYPAARAPGNHHLGLDGSSLRPDDLQMEAVHRDHHGGYRGQSPSSGSFSSPTFPRLPPSLKPSAEETNPRLFLVPSTSRPSSGSLPS